MPGSAVNGPLYFSFDRTSSAFTRTSSDNSTSVLRKHTIRPHRCLQVRSLHHNPSIHTLRHRICTASSKRIRIQDTSTPCNNKFVQIHKRTEAKARDLKFLVSGQTLAGQHHLFRLHISNGKAYTVK